MTLSAGVIEGEEWWPASCNLILRNDPLVSGWIGEIDETYLIWHADGIDK